MSRLTKAEQQRLFLEDAGDEYREWFGRAYHESPLIALALLDTDIQLGELCWQGMLGEIDPPKWVRRGDRP